MGFEQAANRRWSAPHPTPTPTPTPTPVAFVAVKGEQHNFHFAAIESQRAHTKKGFPRRNGAQIASEMFLAQYHVHFGPWDIFAFFRFGGVGVQDWVTDQFQRIRTRQPGHSRFRPQTPPQGLILDWCRTWGFPQDEGVMGGRGLNRRLKGLPMLSPKHVPVASPQLDQPAPQPGAKRQE